MATSENRTAVVIPTNLVKGIVCAASTDASRILTGFNVKGRAYTTANGNRRVELRIAATDSFVLVEFEHAYTFKPDGVDVPDEFDWTVKPTDKLNGASDYVRIEPDADGAHANVRTYKGNVAFGCALADVDPTSYHVWEMPEGRYPTYDKLWPASVTTVGNVTVDAAVWCKAEKAITTAYGSKASITLRGIGTKGSALEFAVYGDKGALMARAIVMPTRESSIDRGRIDGADPAELKTAEERYEAQAAISDKLRARVDELVAMVEQMDAEIKRLESQGGTMPVEPDEVEAPEPNTVVEPVECMGIVPAPTHAVAFFVPDGCTVSVSKVGNAWLEGPATVTKANAKQLKADGWKWAKQRKQWWRKLAA